MAPKIADRYFKVFRRFYSVYSIVFTKYNNGPKMDRKHFKGGNSLLYELCMFKSSVDLYQSFVINNIIFSFRENDDAVYVVF